ncbi:protein unc-93 homolog A-like [Clavelina lepadiformis]|uniref:protein unc-93 homolog A-like n=1 Tax=Clavelina lepadiformis TaxID=159417 RepID=UPI004042B0C9
MADDLSRCKRSVAILCLALYLMQTSFGALEGLQSSLNHSTGTTALALLYISYLLTSLFLPPLIITRLECRKTLSLAALCYSIYIAANFYPKPYTLLPAAIINGFGAGLLWSTAVVYINRLSATYACARNQKEDKYTKHFFSIIYSFVNLGSCSGAVIMSVIFNRLSNNSVSPVGNTYNVTLSMRNDSLSNFNNASNMLQKHCGFHYTHDNSNEVSDRPTISTSTLYVLLSVYLFLSLLASFLYLLLSDIDDKKGSNTENSNGKNPAEENTQMLSTGSDENANRVQAPNTSDTKTTSLDKIISYKESDTFSDGSANFSESNFSLVKSTLALLLTDKVALLFVIHTLNTGILKAFSRATFNEAWVSCSLGIEYVGHTMILYSSTLTVSSFLSAQMLRLLGTKLLFGLTMALEVTICITLLVWKPRSEDAAIFFLITALFATCYGVVKTQVPSAYCSTFSKTKKQAGALVCIMEGLGLSLMFGLSGSVAPFGLLILYFSVSVVGYGLFLFGYIIQTKDIRYWKVKDANPAIKL